MAIDSRSNLKARFKTGLIPTENDFVNLIDSSPNLNDDHLNKAPNTPLRIGNTDSLQKMIEFFRGAVSGGTAVWSVGLKAVNNQQGFAVMQGNTGRLFIQESTGNVGINYDNPQAPLTFAQTHGAKIALWPNQGNCYYGFEIQPGQLITKTESRNADIVFGYQDVGAAFTETMRIKGNGRVGIGRQNPELTLDVAGTFRVSGQSTLQNVTLNNIESPFLTSSAAVVAINRTLMVTIPGNINVEAIITNRQIRANGILLGGADFTEFFESENKQEIPIGTSVVITPEGAIRPATKKDIPVGVISVTPSIVCNNFSEWPEKYLKDDFGKPLTEEAEEDVATPDGRTERKTVQKPILNPDYDPNREYVPRSQRPEWHPVGLLGQLHLRKGQPVGPTWVKMKDISDNVELWLVK